MHDCGKPLFSTFPFLPLISSGPIHLFVPIRVLSAPLLHLLSHFRITRFSGFSHGLDPHYSQAHRYPPKHMFIVSHTGAAAGGGIRTWPPRYGLGLSLCELGGADVC